MSTKTFVAAAIVATVALSSLNQIDAATPAHHFGTIQPRLFEDDYEQGSPRELLVRPEPIKFPWMDHPIIGPGGLPPERYQPKPQQTKPRLLEDDDSEQFLKVYKQHMAQKVQEHPQKFISKGGRFYSEDVLEEDVEQLSVNGKIRGGNGGSPEWEFGFEHTFEEEEEQKSKWLNKIKKAARAINALEGAGLLEEDEEQWSFDRRKPLRVPNPSHSMKPLPVTNPLDDLRKPIRSPNQLDELKKKWRLASKQ